MCQDLGCSSSGGSAQTLRVVAEHFSSYVILGCIMLCLNYTEWIL